MLEGIQKVYEKNIYLFLGFILVKINAESMES